MPSEIFDSVKHYVFPQMNVFVVNAILATFNTHYCLCWNVCNKLSQRWTNRISNMKLNQPSKPVKYYVTETRFCVSAN